MPLFLLHISFFMKVSQSVVMDLILAVGLSGPCHRGEEWFKDGQEGGRGGKSEGTTAGPGAGNGTGWAGVFWSMVA